MKRFFASWWILPGIAIVLCAIALWIYRPWSANNSNFLIVSGNIEAHESLLSFKDIESRITVLPFDEGQWVDAGTLIAQVDDKDYRQQVKVAEASVASQQQQLSAAMHQLTAAHDTVASDRADLAEKTIDYKRAQDLWSADALATQSRDLARTAMMQSQAVYKRDQALEAAAKKNVDVVQANLKNAEETLRLTKITLSYTNLYAPFSGVILVRNAELGEVVQPGTPVFTLADLDHVWLRAYVNETDLGRIRFGQSAWVSSDSYPGQKYLGRISMISQNAEFTPKSVETHTERVTLVYRIRIDIQNQSHELKPGMPADALIDLKPSGSQ